MNSRKTIPGGWNVTTMSVEVPSRRPTLGGFAAAPAHVPSELPQVASVTSSAAPERTTGAVLAAEWLTPPAAGEGDPAPEVLDKLFPGLFGPDEPLSTEEVSPLRPPVPVAAMLARGLFALGAFVSASAIAIAVVR